MIEKIFLGATPLRGYDSGAGVGRGSLTWVSYIRGEKAPGLEGLSFESRIP